MRPKISIIIPVYNTAAYLQRCLDSICAQTLREIEVICVNDASPDNSLEFLQEYAARDNRIVIVNFSRNLGVSAARNAGIAISRGNYLGFVDSDDYIDPHFYESLYAKAHATNAGIVKAGIQWHMEDGTERQDTLNSLIQQDKIEFASQFFTGIYHTEFIREKGIDFPLGISNGEDLAFLTKAVCLAPSVEIINDALYHYNRRSDSADSAVYTVSQMQAIIGAQKNIISFLNRQTLDVVDYTKVCYRAIIKCSKLWSQAAPEDKSEAVILSAEAAMQVFTLCLHQNAIAKHLISLHQHILLKFLMTDNVASFADFLSWEMTPQQKMLANLRSRMHASKYL